MSDLLKDREIRNSYYEFLVKKGYTPQLANLEVSKLARNPQKMLSIMKNVKIICEYFSERRD